jgi:hypothetical protein
MTQQSVDPQVIATAMMRSLSTQPTTMNGSDMYRAKPEDDKWVDVDAEIRQFLESPE